jgi:predicted DNA-binding protein (UPF0251 family)
MPRSKKQRFIGHRPPVAVFKPAGVPARALRWARLGLDGYEAMRLADAEGLSQAEVAEWLGVSRPTVSRILADARRTVARALSEGQALAIEGGPVQYMPPPPLWGPGGPGRGDGHGRGRRGWGWRRRGG